MSFFHNNPKHKKAPAAASAIELNHLTKKHNASSVKQARFCG